MLFLREPTSPRAASPLADSLLEHGPDVQPPSTLATSSSLAGSLLQHSRSLRALDDAHEDDSYEFADAFTPAETSSTFSFDFGDDVDPASDGEESRLGVVCTSNEQPPTSQSPHVPPPLLSYQLCRILGPSFCACGFQYFAMCLAVSIVLDTTNAVFQRRISLDICWRIPTPLRRQKAGSPFTASRLLHDRRSMCGPRDSEEC